MKIGCILVKSGAFLKKFKTMSNYKNHKNMEIIQMKEKIKSLSVLTFFILQTLVF